MEVASRHRCREFGSGLRAVHTVSVANGPLIPKASHASSPKVTKSVNSSLLRSIRRKSVYELRKHHSCLVTVATAPQLSLSKKSRSSIAVDRSGHDIGNRHLR